MKNKLIIPVIIAGGNGIRLWPLSRSQYPKQFLPLLNEQSLLQATLLRIKSLKNIMAPVLVCQEDYRFLLAEQLRNINIVPQAIILEPVLRNTAPAIALAAHWAAKYYPEAVLLILPADHVIQNCIAFVTAVEQAVLAMQDEQLVTFGIKPTSPETAYGYIKFRSDVAKHLLAVESFVEKPALECAQQYLADGHYYWNSGMFLFTATAYLDELKAFLPAVFQATHAAMAQAHYTQDFVRPEKIAFEQCQAISIDYAVMEKTQRAMMLPLHVSWSDIGSWNALYEQQQRDCDGNVLQGNVVVKEVKNSYIRADKRIVAVGGLENIIVVDTPDALLVMDRSHSQALRDIVASLTLQKHSEVELPALVHRPWGTYQIILKEAYFLIKKIIINPGQKISLQLHQHRAEHWIIVKGVVTVINGDSLFDLHRDQSTYIPLGKQHRMINNTQEVVVLIEIQIGEHLAEDDIARLEDAYGRTN